MGAQPDVSCCFQLEFFSPLFLRLPILVVVKTSTTSRRAAIRWLVRRSARDQRGQKNVRFIEVRSIGAFQITFKEFVIHLPSHSVGPRPI